MITGMKMRPDENLKLHHSILYGKTIKVHLLKRNIGLFSGFVWDVNEEKQRLKVKERIDKCVRDKLLFFCDILNLPVTKSCSKKEDLSVKLLEFLESPHVTTEILLADIEKAKKLKRKAKSSKSPRSGRKAVKTASKYSGPPDSSDLRYSPGGSCGCWSDSDSCRGGLADAHEVRLSSVQGEGLNSDCDRPGLSSPIFSSKTTLVKKRNLFMRPAKY
ncbi:hypothetical protein POM88_051609 [Heracleum sosnowskyi]|uniref:Uncharacterized protein n=1 Tax=Heracleum sosnowskyi TaxID=360622 RepID=A0AAD8M3V5_9APIA|nr:hypothetical protein POM88_051609 [Heracleum sosnowskyi]